MGLSGNCTEEKEQEKNQIQISYLTVSAQQIHQSCIPLDAWMY
jgi:hypothetical protein